MNKTQEKATARPWTHKRPKTNKHRASEWIMSDQNFVAKVYGGTDFIKTREETVANAELIVKAVNSFDDLVEACQFVIDRVNEKGSLDIIGDEAVLECIEQALTKAKGGV